MLFHPFQKTEIKVVCNVLIGLTLVPENTNISCLFKSPISLDEYKFFNMDDNIIYNTTWSISQASSLPNTPTVAPIT